MYAVFEYSIWDSGKKKKTEASKTTTSVMQAGAQWMKKNDTSMTQKMY